MKNTSIIPKFVIKTALVVVFFGFNLNSRELPGDWQNPGLLGYGFDSAKQKMLQSECVASSIVEAGSSESEITYTDEADFEEIASSLAGSYSSSGDAIFMKSSQSMSYSQKNKKTNSRMNWFFNFDVKAKTRTLKAGDLRITPHAEELLERRPDLIEEQCGDEYISHIEYGARLTVTMTVEFASSEDKKAFNSLVELEVDAVAAKASVKGSVDLAIQQMNARANIKIRANQKGGEEGRLSKILNQSVVRCRLDNMTECLNTFGGVLAYARDDFSKQLENSGHLAVLKYHTTKYADSQARAINGSGFIVDHHIQERRKEIQEDYWKQSENYHRARFINNRLADLASAEQAARVQNILSAADRNMKLLVEAMETCLETPKKCREKEIELEKYDLKDLEVLVSDEVDSRTNLGKLLKAAKSGNKAEVHKIISLAGPNIIREYDPKGYLPFHYSVAAGLHEVVQLFVVRDKNRPEKKDGEAKLVDLPCTDENAYTPMCLAARGGKKRHNLCIDILISDGAKVDAPTAFGLTPLQVAASCGNEKTMRELIRLGANIGIKDIHGRFIHHLAAEKGDGNLIRYLVNNQARGVNWEDNHNAIPLHWAARAGNVEAINELLLCGSNIHKKDVDGATPLHWAAKGGSLEAINMLLSAGADPLMVDNRQKMAIHYGLRHRLITERLVDLYEIPPMHVRDFVGHSSRVIDAIFSPMGDFIATASIDDTIKLWELKNGNLLITLAHKDRTHMTFSPNGKMLATSSPNSAKLWDIKAKKFINSFELKDKLLQIKSLSFDSYGKILIASTRGERIFWEIKTGKRLPNNAKVIENMDKINIEDRRLDWACRDKFLQSVDGNESSQDFCYGHPSQMLLTSNENKVRLWSLSFVSILHSAIEIGNPKVVKAIAKKLPLLPFIKHPQGYTPLELAQRQLEKGHADEKANRKQIVEFLKAEMNS
jgi:WD40 repeat protein